MWYGFLRFLQSINLIHVFTYIRLQSINLYMRLRTEVCNLNKSEPCFHIVFCNLEPPLDVAYHLVSFVYSQFPVFWKALFVTFSLDPVNGFCYNFPAV